MEAKNKTVIDKKLFIMFQRFYMRAFRKSPVPGFIIFAVSVIAAIALAIFAVVENAKGFMLSAFVFAMISVTLFLMYAVFPGINFKKSFLKNAEISYVFYGDKFNIKMKNDKVNICEDISYGSLFRVYDAPHAYYIFIAKAQALLVSKEGFENADDINKTSEAFSSSLGKKYIRAK
ncbi:MAG: YcxB family protein [Eubacteriales bacterium]